MIENLSYKRKFFLLLVVGIIFLVLVFKLNISKTIALGRQWKTLEHQLVQISDIRGKEQQLKSKLERLNNLLGSAVSPGDLRERVLSSVVNQAPGKNIDLYEIPKVYTYTDGDMKIYTNKIVLKGSFKSLLEYIYILETKVKLSRIRSVNFIRTKQRGTKYESMYVEIYLQNIEIDR